MTIPPRRGRPSLVKDCDCPRARHKHGTRNMFVRHSCKCQPCRAASSKYHQEVRRASSLKANGELRVDAGPARARIHSLHAAGMSTVTIAELSGISRTALRRIAGAGQSPPTQKVPVNVAAALAAISYRDVMALKVHPNTPVDATVPRLQLQELQARGWCLEDIGADSDVSTRVLKRILSGYKSTEAMRIKLSDSYLHLRTTTPPTKTPLETARSEQAVARAAAHGWTVDMADEASYSRAA